MEHVPFLSPTNEKSDSNIILIPAPLPKPCKNSSDRVRFCTDPYLLTMTRERFEYFTSLWGRRKTKLTHAQKLTQISSYRFALDLHYGEERPMVWISPERPGTIRMYPVFPEISQVQLIGGTGGDVEWSPLSSTTSELRFSPELLPPLSQVRLDWNDEGYLGMDFTPPKAPYHIMIDPGHGGSERGAGREGLVEADLNLELALILAKAFHDKKVDVSLTRQSDEVVPLLERLVKARTRGISLFLSLHHDSGNYERFNTRPLCIFARADVSQLCRTLTEAMMPLYPERIAYAKRYLFVLQGIEVPAILLEVFDLSNADHRELLTNVTRRTEFYEKWSREVVSTVLKQLNRDADSSSPVVD